MSSRRAGSAVSKDSIEIDPEANERRRQGDYTKRLQVVETLKRWWYYVE